MALRGVAFQRELVVRQAVEVDAHVLGIVVVLAFDCRLAEHLGLRGDLVFALQASPQASGNHFLIGKGQRRGIVAVLRVAVDFRLGEISADKRRHVPGAAGMLCNVVTQASAEGFDVAAGIAFFTAFVGTQLELALEAVVIQMAGRQRHVRPDTVLLVLGECRAQVSVELVVGVVAAGFEFLVIETRRQADAPGIIDAVAAPDVQVGSVAVGTDRAVLTVKVLMLSAARNNGSPLADALPVLPIGQPLVAQFILMRAHGALGHFRQQGQLPRRRQQGVRVIGDQALPGFGGVHRVVVDQLGRVRRGAVDAVAGVLGATVAAEAGGDEVLVGGQAKLRRVGERLFEQYRNVERDDFGIDVLQSAYQFIIELGAELGRERLQRGAIERRGEADIGQQPDHDVFGAGGLQCLHAVGQSIGCSAGLGQAGDATLQEVVTTTRQVIQCVRVGPEVVRRQVAGAGAFAGGGNAGDRIQDLIRAVTADGPVVAIRLAVVGTHRRR
ncbi:hypothetical protein D3C73_754740 [compost metagenome]